MYTEATGNRMSDDLANEVMQAAVGDEHVSSGNAYVSNWVKATNIMLDRVGVKGTFTYNEDGDYLIYAQDRNEDGSPNHFINEYGEDQIFDVLDGNVKDLDSITLQEGRETRGPIN